MAKEGVGEASASRGVVVGLLVAQGLWLVFVCWVWGYLRFSRFARWSSASWVEAPLWVGPLPQVVVLLAAGASLVSARGVWVGATWAPTLVALTATAVGLVTAFQLYMHLICGFSYGVVILVSLTMSCAASIWGWNQVRIRFHPT